ncbi:ABC transporter substrate-binding protein [Falsigemmobacter intermedius]|uniref:ABC transporter substrate-binding protein n=1 Tax=Falsigemmobacter intermedius TaxID=1553448 RepID=UPI003F032E01
MLRFPKSPGPLLAASFVLMAAPSVSQAQSDSVLYRAAVLRIDAPGPMPISRLSLPAEDAGFAGATLGTADNATTGAFMKQSFETETKALAPEALVPEMERLLGEGVQWFVILGDSAAVSQAADLAGDRAVIFNALSTDDALRAEGCRANLLHIAPSDAMLSDALAQYLVWKRWSDWFLIEGSHPQDRALGAAYRRAAEKFGARLTAEKVFEDTGGARRTDSGHVQVQAQMPVFTQGAANHHVVVAADHSGVFADWLPYHTWDARPVAGSAGLRPVTWHPAHEAWGAMQWQSRFEKLSGRQATEADFQVWTALRVIGEAATRTKGGDFAALRDHILSPEFSLAAFKGQKLTFRDWDGQLRQPILLASDRVISSVSPQEEFLHQTSQLDTLGIDRQESSCKK